MPANPTSPMDPILPIEPTPTVATSTATNQMPVVKSAAMSIPVTVYNLAQGKFEGIPYPSGRFQVEGSPSTPAAICPSKGNNLKPHLLSQPAKSERTPHGLTTCQPPQTSLRPGQIGHFSLLKHPQLLRWRKQKLHSG